MIFHLYIKEVRLIVDRGLVKVVAIFGQLVIFMKNRQKLNKFMN